VTGQVSGQNGMFQKANRPLIIENDFTKRTEEEQEYKVSSISMFNFSTPTLNVRGEASALIELTQINAMLPDIISRPYGLVESGEEFDLITKKLFRAKRREKRFHNAELTEI
jgi:hypothetical protein